MLTTSGFTVPSQAAQNTSGANMLEDVGILVAERVSSIGRIIEIPQLSGLHTVRNALQRNDMSLDAFLANDKALMLFRFDLIHRTS